MQFFFYIIQYILTHKLISVLVLRARFPPCTMSPWTYCPTAQCSPRHSTIVQTVPLSAKSPPMLIVLGRVYKGAMERTGQFEVSSIKEDSM